jgi:hypothetical protein
MTSWLQWAHGGGPKRHHRRGGVRICISLPVTCSHLLQKLIVVGLLVGGLVGGFAKHERCRRQVHGGPCDTTPRSTLRRVTKPGAARLRVVFFWLQQPILETIRPNRFSLFFIIENSVLIAQLAHARLTPARLARYRQGVGRWAPRLKDKIRGGRVFLNN